VIPYGLDGNIFKPGSRSDARKQLGLPEGDRIVLTGAVGAVSDERKGFGLLVDALRKCWSAGGTEKWRLLVFGADAGPGLETLGIPVSYCGTVKAEADLARIYQAADVFALPSIQDNLPNTALEALGCGKPIVAFKASGLPSIVREGRTGWLATPFSADSLAIAVRSAIEATYGEEWSQACRAEFERTYAWPGPAKSYMNLYEEMLKRALS
jgi:glycosyltransferase involved in cell wall biosynthesis